MLRSFSAASVVAPMLLSFASFASLAAFAACGAGDVSPPPPIATDGGGTDGPGQTDTGTPEAPPGTVAQTGKIVALNLNTPVVGATVSSSAGGTPSTTDAKGAYALNVDPTKSFHLQVAAPGYYSLLEQETQITTGIDLGKTSLLAESTAQVLLATLNGYDASLGVLSVAIEKKPSCADEGGATISYTVDGQPPAAPTTMYYFVGNVPSSAGTSAESGDFPHAVIFNLPPDKPVAVTVKHPTCTMVPFPVTKDLSTEPSPPFGVQGSGTITYVSGTLTASAGKNTSFLRVFLK